MRTMWLCVSAATVATAVLIWRWWVAVGIPPLPQAAVSAVAVATWLAVCTVILRRIIGNWPTAVLAVSIGSVVVAGVSAAGADSRLPNVGLVAGGVVLATGMLAIASRSTTLWSAWKTGLPAAGVVVLAALAAAGWPDLSQLVWDGSDQDAIAAMLSSLLRLEFDTFYFTLGLPALLAPVGFALNGWETIDRHILAGAINLVVLPATVMVVLPTAIGLCVRAIRGRWRSALVVAAVMSAYLLMPPGYVPERNAMLVPLRLSGLVYGPEVVGLIMIAVSVWMLARRRWDPILLGILAGLGAVTHERHALLLLPAALLLFTLGNRYETVKTGLVAAAVTVPQVLYWRVVYGGWLLPNRMHVWEGGRAADRAEAYASRYNTAISGDPVDSVYLAANLPQVTTGLLWLLVLAATAAVLLWLLDRSRWRVWAYTATVTLATVTVAAAWINLTVSWRYAWWAAPATGLALAGVARRLQPDVQAWSRRS